jgi:hypothetical protein
MEKVENGYKSEGFVYNYAIWDRTSLNFMFADDPEVYASTLKEAFETAADMFEDGCVEQIEIGMPNGDVIQVDARSVDFEDDDDEY